MLLRLTICPFEEGHRDERSTLVTLIATIEKTTPLVILPHRTSDSKLQFLETAAAGKSWALQASFRLSDSHTYSQLVDALFHSIRTLRVHGASPDVSRVPQLTTYRSYPWEKNGQ